MIIRVTDKNTRNEIFNGDADEFLEMNDYDTELEMFLNDIESISFGEKEEFYLCDSDELIIVERLKNYL